MRIRTVKPSFMQHEELQDLEVSHPGKYIMLTFQGLWMLANARGKFEYKPRLMKLEILPFIPFDLQDTLDVLEAAGYFKSYEVNGKKYGIIPSFLEHQRLNTKEINSDDKIPDPEIVTENKILGQTGDAPGTHPTSQEGELGKGNEIVEEESEKIDESPFQILVELKPITDLKKFITERFPKTHEDLQMKTKNYFERQEMFMLRNNERSYTTTNDFLNHYRNFILKPPPVEKEKFSGQKEKVTRTDQIIETHEQYINSLSAG